MSGETTEIIESLSIDGPIGIGPVVGIGVMLALAFAWLLWTQRRATGSMWAGIFWILRVVALGLILWMLLGPSWVTHRRTTKPQSIAILVDTSDSMDVRDPAIGPRQIRWSQSASIESSDDDSLARCDRATVCVRMAFRRSQLAQQAVLRHQTSKKIRQHFESVSNAVGRAIDHLETGLAALNGHNTDIAGKTQRILTRLQGSIAHDLRNLIASLDEANAPPAGELTESLLTVEEALGSVERRLRELTRNLEQDAVGDSSSQTPTDTAGLSRREYVIRTLEAVQRSIGEQSEHTINIQPFRFDRHAASASLDTGWKSILQSTGPEAPTAEPGASGDEPALTNISAVLNQLGRTASAKAIRSAILISDGAHNDFDALAPQEVAASLGDIPVHVVPIGHSVVLRDAMLHRVDAPTAVVENDSILIDIIVTAFQCAGETSTLVLRRNGKQIDEQIVSFNKDRTDRRTFFQVNADELGRHEFELSLEPLDDESNSTNNITKLTVNVIQDSLRVLLVDRIARWEYRYLEQLFRRDKSITFDKLLFHPQVSATGKVAETGALPVDADGWSHYDVVVMGDLEAKHLNEQSQRALDEFVRTRGGHLIVIAGKNSMPEGFSNQILLDLLPVEKTQSLTSTEGLNITLTPSGLAHPALTIAETAAQSDVVWKKQFEYLPLYSLPKYSQPKPTAETLIAVEQSGQATSVESGLRQSPEHALLSWHQAGAGRVVYMSAPATYRLRYRRGDRYHHRFWGQMLRWLTAAERAVGTQTVRISTDSIRYETGEAIDINVRLFDQEGSPVSAESIAALATPTEGAAVSIDLLADEKIPGRYLGSFSALPPGAYRITPTGQTIEQLLPLAKDKELTEARITVADSGSPEQLNTRCNVALLQQIAEVTGGQMIPPTAIDEILTLSTLAQEVSERIERQPLWTRWSLLAIAFACLCTEWIVRKRLGLV